VKEQLRQTAMLAVTAIAMWITGSRLLGEVARAVDLVALAGTSILFGVTLVAFLRAWRERPR
jgi:hypothetical protein